MNSIRPNIFKFGNYRSYLQDLISFLRVEKKYSNRTLAKEIGVKGHTYLNMIVAGKRSLQPKIARKIAKAADLNGKETKFFLLLIQFNEATDLEDRNEYFERLGHLARREMVQPHLLTTYEVYSDWRNIAILGSLGSHQNKYPFSKVAEQLSMSVKEVHEVLVTLAKVGLAEKVGTEWRRTSENIETPPEVESLLIANFHHEMTKLALDRIKSLPKEKRELGGLTLRLNEESFEKLRVLMREFNDDAFKAFADNEKASTLYHLQLQLFPIMSLKS